MFLALTLQHVLWQARAGCLYSWRWQGPPEISRKSTKKTHLSFDFEKPHLLCADQISLEMIAGCRRCCRCCDRCWSCRSFIGVCHSGHRHDTHGDAAAVGHGAVFHGATGGDRGELAEICLGNITQPCNIRLQTHTHILYI